LAILIILQFMMQTALIAAVAMVFLPIVHDIAFDAGVFDNASAWTQSIVDNFWNWSIIFFIAAMAGNIVWFLRALQRQQVEQQTF